MQTVPQQTAIPVNLHGNILQQQVAPVVEAVNNQVVIPDVVDDSLVSILGFSMKKTYVYLILLVLIILVGSFVWKWYSGKGKEEKEDKKEKDKKDRSDSESYSEEESRGPPGHQVPSPQQIMKMNQDLMIKLKEQHMIIEDLQQQLNQRDEDK